MQTHAWAISAALYAPPLSNPTTYEVLQACRNEEVLMVDLRNIAFCITGFSGPDLLHLGKLIVLMGGDYYESLTRNRSLLLTPDNQVGGQKVTKAKEWGIPVVNVGWFWNVVGHSDEADLAPWCEGPVGTHIYVRQF